MFYVDYLLCKITEVVHLQLIFFVFLSVADPGFSPGGAPTPKSAIIFQFFAENCMKMKEFGPPGGRTSLAPPLGSANAFPEIQKYEVSWKTTIEVNLLQMVSKNQRFDK